MKTEYVVVSTPSGPVHYGHDMLDNKFVITKKHWEALKPNEDQEFEGDHDMVFNLLEFYENCEVITIPNKKLDFARKLCGTKNSALERLNYFEEERKTKEAEDYDKQMNSTIIVQHPTLKFKLGEKLLIFERGAFTVKRKTWLDFSGPIRKTILKNTDIYITDEPSQDSIETINDLECDEFIKWLEHRYKNDDFHLICK